MFNLVSPYQPTGDQPSAIDQLVSGLEHGLGHQVLLGVTGSGKTFTMANIIKKMQKPTLIISHNKTLAAQLYQEFRSFFPQNSVCYFVSYYDYYQPEAYIPRTDTYIEKETQINEQIDKLRLSATANLLTRKDTIIVASVSCIYNIGSPKEYGNFVLELRRGVRLNRESVMKRLVELQYTRADYGFHRGSFRVRGDIIDIYPAYEDTGVRILEEAGIVQDISIIDPLTGEELEKREGIVVYPAKHYMTNPKKITGVFDEIQRDLQTQIGVLQKQNKMLEAHRLGQKVNYDLEMIQEVGYVNGIENYSRYFDGRKPGDPPYTLLDYYKEPYKDDWLLFIDESHMTIPQIRGMYNGDQARKKTLVDFGFRLPAAMDNRPLQFAEFMGLIPQTIYVSATPAVWELSMAKEEANRKKGKGDRGKGTEEKTETLHSKPLTLAYDGVAQQLIRPTGIIDPAIEIRPSKNQITDLIGEILIRKKRKERVLVTTLTKRMAEELAKFMEERSYVKEVPTVHYLHSDVETLERSDILDDLRSGKYDVLIGINLLREGLDLPEVSLVAILDADKEGFLRSETSLVQTMGRAARHISGMVIMYADTITGSMRRAIDEIERRRNVQIAYNKTHHITPIQVTKPIREKLVEREVSDPIIHAFGQLDASSRRTYRELLELDPRQMTPRDKVRFIKTIEAEMRSAANDLNFELATTLRDKVRELR